MNEQFTDDRRQVIDDKCATIMALIYDLGNDIPDGHQTSSAVFQAYRLMQAIQGKYGKKGDKS